MYSLIFRPIEKLTGTIARKIVNVLVRLTDWWFWCGWEERGAASSKVGRRKGRRGWEGRRKEEKGGEVRENRMKGMGLRLLKGKRVQRPYKMICS